MSKLADDAQADWIRQHQLRMAHMPYLYFRAKPEIRAWAEPWQAQIHTELQALECVFLDPSCFIAPGARLFAEPHRPIRVGPRAAIATDAFIHGPVELGPEVSINPFSVLNGGRLGIRIGAQSRIATHVCLMAFNHGMAADTPVCEQPVTSLGISIGADVWIGAGAKVVDGVTIGDHAVIGAGAVVTRAVAPFSIVAGNPARPIGDRRTRGNPAP